MKKADTQKEEKFIEHYSMTGNTAKLILELGGYNHKNIKLSIDTHSEQKTDKQLVDELQILMKDMKLN